MALGAASAMALAACSSSGNNNPGNGGGTGGLGGTGRAFPGEGGPVNPVSGGAGPPMPTVTPSASKGTLQTHGWKCWHRIIPNDNVEGSQGADWLARTGAKKVFVLDD